MGVYIPKMKKPQYCGTCILCLDDSRICHGYCMIFHRKVNMMELDKDCPLVDVPEPHGRLFDADEFLKRAIGTKCFRGDSALMLEELVGESTTIIPASEREE